MNLWTTATTTEAARRAASVAVLPVGSFEQHGSYLPLATDTIVASAIAAAVADRYDLLLLPPITISCSHEHAAWPGTVSISARTLDAIITDVRESLQHSGVERLVIVNGHGGNYVLSNVVQQANVARPQLALFPNRQAWEVACQDAGIVSSMHDDMHAGEIETSVLLEVAPESVREGYDREDHVAEHPHLLTLGMRAYTESGVIGRPSLASSDKGRLLLASLTASFRETLEFLNK
ncbi:creatininase family protein [Micromonospora sp. WMMA1976]|uniref:creatininase family protein n=1 Tax=Micromonospora sp. WMMA1976 TaxID=3014995 RepID=UPI00248AB898|nr:creatininase family protein [Micromonospora sp. WMMA1976]WBC05327.1 creatininase family protein [Micromonospora sp. WMMA1976]